MRIGFIGSGAMVAAIARGAVAAGMDGSEFLFTDAHGVHAPALAAETGGSVASSNASLAHRVDVLVLGVKPHAQSAVIERIAHIVRERPDMCVVSLAAGRTIESIAGDFGAAVPIIRVMPNVNAQIGHSMSAICSAGASEEQVAAVESLMNRVGRTIRIDEKDFPAFGALAGCSPAWVFQIVEALARAGVKHGLSKDASVEIAAQAILGSAGLVLHSAQRGVVPSALIDRVCSPGGTTIAGLLAAEAQGLSTSLIGAVDAAIARDAEISRTPRR